jgi:hypothetical protein
MTCLTQSPYDFVLAKLATKKTVQYFGGHIKEMRPDIYKIAEEATTCWRFCFPDT